MTTIFQSRQLVQDELVALFVADGSWQQVWGYFPGVNAFMGKSPVLVITPSGTGQSMESKHVNPTSHILLLSTFVLAYRQSDSWFAEDANDLLNAMEVKVRQIIRDNAGGGTFADNYEFDQTPSDVSNQIIEGLGYIIETRSIIANLAHGTTA